MKKNIHITKLSIVLIIVYLLIPVVSCSKKKNSDIVDHSSSVKTISSMSELSRIINGDDTKMLVFDLYADWCVPCKMLTPIFSSLSKAHTDRAIFYRINIDNNPDIAAAFGVQGIPHVVFIRDKKSIYALTGVHPKESYERVLNSCGEAESANDCAQLLKSTQTDG